MSTATNDLSLTVSRLIRATPESLYKAWLDPEMLMRFMIPCVGGSCPQAKVDARVGGDYRIVMNDGDKDIPHWGRYIALAPYSSIAFTWNSPFSEDTEVQVTFTPETEGTRVELTHIKFHSEDQRDGHNAGWSRIMDELTARYA